MKTKTVIILAAGYGKRLLPITKKIPKPLIKVYNKELLGHVIDIVLNIGIKNIVINTHYKAKLIDKYLLNHYQNLKIKISYEPNILDTGGGIKNAINFFKEKKILVLNSDVFWHNSNAIDLKKLLIEHENNNFMCTLLLSDLSNTFGIVSKKGDFYFQKNLIFRNTVNREGFVYSGAQVINLDIFKYFNKNIFSLNEIWDLLIKKKSITGLKMNSKLLHLGTKKGFNLLKNFKP